MSNKEKIRLFTEKLDEAERIIVGAASGMSAAAGFRFYYVDDAVFRSIAGSLADKYGYTNYFDGYYCRAQSRSEWRALVLRAIKYLYDCPTGETYTDLAELLKDRDYYIVTTNQDAQFYRVFPENKITRLQGDSRYFQCAKRCHDEIYYNRDMVMELVPRIKDDALPEGLWPRCPNCGAEMEPWVRGPNFLEGAFYQKEIARYLDALKGSLNKKVLFLELGVGMMTPMFIKEPFMDMVYQWPKASYVTINPRHAIVPKEIEARSLAIDGDILIALKEALGKDASGIKEHKEIFNPRKVY